MKFHKYHGLGNDYIVLDPAEVGGELSPDKIRLICHRNYGVGADGILLGPISKDGRECGLRIFNPDGSEAEKSGNGLWFFSRYLYDTGKIGEKPFEILTRGGLVRCQVRDGGRGITVEMGRLSFDSRAKRGLDQARRSRDVPVPALSDEIAVLDKTFRYCAADIGNPHCVVLDAEVTKENACKYGPIIETDARFPNRTNVQFLEVLDRDNIRIEIWERGAGYTLASGSSSCAAAAVVHRLGLCDNEITTHMPGGQLRITIADDYAVTMTGPVAKVCEGVMSEEMFSGSQQ